MFCSVIIPTIGRPSLTQSVLSALTQDFPNERFEIIVVNDSGAGLPEEAWNRADNVTILNTNRVERSFARNTGAAAARGRYLLFLDDDDRILPDTLSQFWVSTQNHAAGMFCGGYRFVDANGNTINEHVPDESGNCFIRFMSGEWQPLQASLFDTSAFHAIGGFLPLGILRGGDEDVDLTRRISLGHEIAGTGTLAAVIRLDRADSSTNYSNLQEQSRQSRDMVLNMPGSFLRLRHSARGRSGNQAYWHGRMVWIYLGSAVWNIRERRVFTAFSRILLLGVSMILSIRYWLSPKFWEGAARPHYADGWLSTINNPAVPTQTRNL